MASRGRGLSNKKRSPPPSAPAQLGGLAPPPHTASTATLGSSAGGPSSATLTSTSAGGLVRRGSFTKVPTFPSAYESMNGHGHHGGGRDEGEDDGGFGGSLELQGVGGADAADAQGGRYAYSTTLRRQPSTDPTTFPFVAAVAGGSGGHGHAHSGAGRGRSSSPHHGSPFQRSASNRYDHPSGFAAALLGSPPGRGHHPLSGDADHHLGGASSSLVGRVIDAGRKAMGKRGYEEIRIDEEERRRSQERRQRETPSAIYAHRTAEDTIAAFATNPTAGLQTSQLGGLLARHGPNEFELPPSEPLWLKFAKQVYENPLILLLLASSAVSALMGQYDDAICVVIAVGIVLTVGFVQEQRSEKSLEALNKVCNGKWDSPERVDLRLGFALIGRQLVPHFCHLIRNGQPLTPLANTLLPGDLVTFSVGDRIPADIRLITAVSLEIDESALTGETRPARKNTTACEKGEGEDTHGEGGGKALGERHCMAFMGTLVRSGNGSGIVVGTGKDSEFGVIFSMMQDVEEKRTPLQLSMDDLAKRLSIFSFGVIGVIFLIGVLQKRDWLEMFTIGGQSVSLAVAAIPEGLPIVTTVTLALGVLRMSKRKAIVKKLPSVEALGSVSVICSDKTGTLTKNEMTVTQLYAVDDLIDLTPHLHTTHFGPRRPDHPLVSPSPAMLKAVLVGNLCNNAFRNETGTYVGQATEVALLNVLSVLEREDERKAFVRKNEIPFSSDTKSMAVTGSLSGGTDLVYLKGAIEAVLAKCRYYYVTDSSTPTLDENTKKIILDRANESAKRGLRVIGMAYGFPTSGKAGATDETGSDLVFVGYQAMMDPPRRGVAHAVSALHGAGVQVVMITGDAEATALSIARELGLKVSPSSSTGSSSCMLGSQVDQLSERELIERVAGVTVFARTTPRHKMAIVKAWQMRGAVVAMTGDGVNDSPALKMADIGISMGKSGTDVAKEAADVILVDDDFSSILPAVEEGRSIFYNIQNFLSFQLSTAVAALSLITLSTLFQLANPLNAMQILFINILMDGPPAQALGVDPVRKETMRRAPRKKNQSVLSRRLMYRVFFSAAMIVFGTMWVYLVEISDGSMSRRDQTMTFTCFVFLDLVSAIQNRGITTAIFRNRMLFLAISVSFVVQLALIYVPLLQHIFQTEALSLRDLMTLLGLAGTSMGLHEGRRYWERKVSEREIMEQSTAMA